MKCRPRQFQILLFCSIACGAQGFAGLSKVNIAKKNLLQVPEESLLTSRREPAGVETIFGKVKDMRTCGARQLVGQNLTGFLRTGNKRRRQRDLGHTTEVRELHHREGIPIAGFQQELKDVASHFSLPPTFQFKGGNSERRALASMKILLEKDYRDLSNKTVIIPATGERVSVVSQFPDVYGDLRLLRFLRKNKESDPVSAGLAFRKYLNWRRENHVDEIRAAVESKSFAAIPDSLQIFAEMIPCDFDITEGQGAVIKLFVGKWQTAKLATLIRREEVLLSDFLVYWMFLFEALHQQLYKQSIKHNQMVFVDAVGDLRGFSLQQLTPAFTSNVMRPWIKQLQCHYPETARRIDVVHPPKVVSLLWRLVTPLLSPGTVAKIRIH